MPLNRRNFLRSSPAAAAAVKEIARDVEKKLASRSLGGTMPSNFYGGEISGGPLTGPAVDGAKRSMALFLRSKDVKNTYRGQVPVTYPDLEDLRSISPAAKRFLTAERHLREQREDRHILRPLQKILGWPQSLEDFLED